MNIDELIDRYFEGETSAEEEREIRAFFSGETIPPHLAEYKPLFGYFENEIQRLERKPEERQPVPAHRIPFISKRAWYAALGIAASLLLLISIAHRFYTEDPCLCAGNYAMIDGHCSTDIRQVRTLALEALQEVSSSAEEYFTPMKDGDSEKELVNKQLKELGRLLSDDN